MGQELKFGQIGSGPARRADVRRDDSFGREGATASCDVEASLITNQQLALSAALSASRLPCREAKGH